MNKKTTAIIAVAGIIVLFFTMLPASVMFRRSKPTGSDDIYREHTNLSQTRKDSLISFRDNRFVASYMPSAATSGVPAEFRAVMDTLIELINQDSITSYIYAMQALPNRHPLFGTPDVSRNWAYDKFLEFGYDSVIIDSSYSSVYHFYSQNVIAYKVGIEHPDLQIIISAHIDVSESYTPGADDDASGSAGVLEIARALSNLETNVTFIFILFDGTFYESQSGAYHYAQNAYDNGDDIVAVLDMDEIGYYGNTDNVYLLYDDFSLLWLAGHVLDSLPELGLIEIEYYGYTWFSNYIHFHDFGYSYVAFSEYLYNPYIGTAQDSTAYLDFTYITRIVKACMAIAYYFGTIAPFPDLIFSYPEGTPTLLTPGVPDTFTVHVTGINGAVINTETGLLGYSLDLGDWNEVSLSYLGGGLFEAILPALLCNYPYVRYAIAIEEATMGYIYDPEDVPFEAYLGGSYVTIFEDDFETDKGWVSEGLWERGTPAGGACYYQICPDYAYSGENIYGYNLDGCYNIGIGETNLISPPFDCSNLAGVRIKFQRWLGVNYGFDDVYDYATIWASYDSINWQLAWWPGDVRDTSWYETVIDLSQVADNHPGVRVRFTMGPAHGPFAACGWNIDDVAIEGYYCGLWDLEILTDTLPDWTATHPYYYQIEAYGGTGSFGWHDKNGDLEGTGLTLSPNGIVSGVVAESQYISFTAVVSDETKATVEKDFEFLINDTISILVDSLPDGTVGEYYNAFIRILGGTGHQRFSDKYGDLQGTGLGLGGSWSDPPEVHTGGNLMGIPETPGEISFTFMATDITGDTAEREYTFYIASGDLICGDVDGNEAVNILDITYLINYLYKDGPAPEMMWAADCNGDDLVNILDITYLIAYIYKGGPDPNCD
jgi:hypothetical protein